MSPALSIISDTAIPSAYRARTTISLACVVFSPTAAAQDSVEVETGQFALRGEIALVPSRVGLSDLA